MVLNSNSALSLYKDKLVRLIKEHSSIVWVKTFDKESVYDILDEICSSEGYKSKYVELKKNCEKDILTWSISLGRKVFRASNSDETNDEKLHVTIKNFVQEKTFDVLVLDDISQLLRPTHADSSLIISCLQDFSYNNSKWKKRDKDKGVGSRYDKTILIISPVFDLIDNFQHMVEILEEPIPDEEDIRHELGFDVLESPVDVDSCDVKGLLQLPSNQSTPQITGSIIDYIKEEEKKGKKHSFKYGRYHYAFSFIKDESNRKKLVGSLKGMYMYDIRHLLYSIQVHSKHGNLNAIEDVSGKQLSECVADEKKRLVQNSGLLQVIEVKEDQAERVGNIANLRAHLELQRRIIDNIEDYNSKMPRPKGVLLVGAPGCGKSEAAKSVAAILNKPLLRLDIGALMGQYVGVSEHNLIEAIRIAEAAHPCVLWIDEIEKAFAGFGNSDSGNDITVMRMVGYFLTWMQERKSLVYLIATANSLDDLRPELLRKGRWDKIMYLTYPDKAGILDILKCCLKKYNLKFDPDEENFSSLKDELIDEIYKQEMSGADIDSLLVEAYNLIFAERAKNRDITASMSDESNSANTKQNVIPLGLCLKITQGVNNVQRARELHDQQLVEKRMQEYKISHGRFDWDLSSEELLNISLDEYKLSTGKFNLSQSEVNQIRPLLAKKIKSSLHEKECIRKIIAKEVCHKGRAEQEEYYKSKGYEPAHQVSDRGAVLEEILNKFVGRY